MMFTNEEVLETLLLEGAWAMLQIYRYSLVNGVMFSKSLSLVVSVQDGLVTSRLWSPFNPGRRSSLSR